MTSKRRGKRPRAPSVAQRPLIKALLDDREDRAMWSVLGDLLQTEGDPRGALVSLMLEREARPSGQLLEAERRYRKQHLAELVPELDEDPEAVAWWRGFPSRLRVTSCETLERVVRDPALRFLDTVALELETAEWADWLAVIGGRPQGWRRLRLDLTSCDDPIELAPLLQRDRAQRQKCFPRPRLALREQVPERAVNTDQLSCEGVTLVGVAELLQLGRKSFLQPCRKFAQQRRKIVLSIAHDVSCEQHGEQSWCNEDTVTAIAQHLHRDRLRVPASDVLDRDTGRTRLRSMKATESRPVSAPTPEVFAIENRRRLPDRRRAHATPLDDSDVELHVDPTGIIYVSQGDWLGTVATSP